MDELFNHHRLCVGTRCDVCISKNEMAQILRNVLVRMRLAIQHRDEFVFARESAEVADRVMLWPQWMDLILYQDGYTFEDVDGYR